MSNRLHMSIAAAVLAVAAVGVQPAWATVAAIPNDTFTLTGRFSKPGQTPFGAGDFTLSFSAPSQSFASGYNLGDVYDIITIGNGT